MRFIEVESDRNLIKIVDQVFTVTRDRIVARDDAFDNTIVFIHTTKPHSEKFMQLSFDEIAKVANEEEENTWKDKFKRDFLEGKSNCFIVACDESPVDTKIPILFIKIPDYERAERDRTRTVRVNFTKLIGCVIDICCRNNIATIFDSSKEVLIHDIFLEIARNLVKLGVVTGFIDETGKARPIRKFLKKIKKILR